MKLLDSVSTVSTDRESEIQSSKYHPSYDEKIYNRKFQREVSYK